jgi:tRNA/tmRNA/rRNA uracil-C5-methylase (TrmA/RlmC/RlmD family)
MGVEGDKRARRDAADNAEGLRQVTGIGGDVAMALKRGLPGGRPQVVVADPPRKGLGRGVTDRLVAAGPARIVYVACEPSALGRDVGYLREGGYALDSVTGYDLFPGTHHVEAVAVLTR